MSDPPTPEESLRKHIDSRFDGLESLIRSGFPGGDPVKHREVHEGFIAEAEQRRAMRRAIWEKMLTGGIWAGLGLTAMAIWEYIKSGVRS